MIDGPGAVDVPKQHRHLLPLALQGGLRLEDVVGEMLGRVVAGVAFRPIRCRLRGWLQNLTPAGSSAPHCAHAVAKPAPHSKQKREPTGFSWPQLGQFTRSFYR